jgi:hypothetical protein
MTYMDMLENQSDFMDLLGLVFSHIHQVFPASERTRLLSLILTHELILTTE